MRGDEQLTDDINKGLPIIPHESLGADCCGCLVAQINGDQADIVCNECGAAIRTVRVGDIQAAMSEMAQTDVISTARCPHCGALTTFPGMSSVEAFICSECGEGVAVIVPVQ
jgi:uncharacterized paraquat-inducible protein A